MGHGESVKVAFISEASAAIGTGHVRETMVIADACRNRGWEGRLWVNKDTPPALRSQSPMPVEVVGGNWASSLEGLGRRFRAEEYGVVLVDFKDVHDSHLCALRSSGVKVVCVEEFGRKPLDAEAIVNFSCVPSRHHYTSSGGAARLFAGPAYFPVPPEFVDARAGRKAASGPVRAVAVCMGGADLPGNSTRILEALRGMQRDMEIHVAVGVAFPTSQVKTLRRSAGDRVHVHEGLESLAGIMRLCDAGFTAGGNVLYEMACAGLPPIVVFEEPHQEEQARIMQGGGFGFCLGPASAFDPTAMRAALHNLDNSDLRSRQAEIGRRMVDGLGAGRIADVIQWVRSGAA